MKANVQDIHRQFNRSIISLVHTVKGVDYKNEMPLCLFTNVFGYAIECDHIIDNDYLISETPWGIEKWKMCSVTIFVLDFSETISIKAKTGIIKVSCFHYIQCMP